VTLNPFGRLLIGRAGCDSRSKILDARGVEHLVTSGSPLINTDWNRWIEFSTPRYNASQVDWFALNARYIASMA